MELDCANSRDTATHNPLPTRIQKISAVGLSTRKRRGEAAEAAFLAKASTLGFAVAKPWGDSEPYDFILDSGRRLWRIQVKSTQRCAESRYRVKASGCKLRYTGDEIDFIVAYIVPEDLWYVIPVAACIGHASLRFYPHDGRKSQLEKYREAWCQMACPRQHSGPNPVMVSPRCKKGIARRSCPFHALPGN
jgi:PD-(D/E)XK endonuclease